MNITIKPSSAIDDIIEIPSNSEELEEKKAAAIRKSDEQKTHLDGLTEFYKFRKHWSWFILICIAILILFQIVLTVCVGCRWLDFKDYKWFLPLTITENFIQLVGLAIIVVKFLFSHQRSN